MKRRNYKVLLTGGHAATAALATIEQILAKTKRNPWGLYWIGSKKAIEGKNVSTLESKYISKTKVEYYSIVAGRLQTRFTIWTIPAFFKIPLGFLHAFFLISRIKPDVIVSFGGYASFPVVFVGWLSNIPIIIHEQTAAAGRANRLASFFAKKVALARKQSKKFFPRKKCVVVGNPVRGKMFEIRPKKTIGRPPTIYITGGSRGSVSINNFVEEILEKLLEDFLVIHHTGYLDIEKFEKIKKSLPPKLGINYRPYSMINPDKVPEIFKKADIIISRAGANTVSEIMVAKRPAILIPLPIAYLDEQRRNAEFSEKFGISHIFDQKKGNSCDLLENIYEVKRNWNNIVKKVRYKKSPDESASEKLYRLIKREVK